MSKNIKNIQFIQGVDFEFIQSLPNNGTKYLLIFDDLVKKSQARKNLLKSRRLEDTKVLVQYI